MCLFMPGAAISPFGRNKFLITQRDIKPWLLILPDMATQEKEEKNYSIEAFAEDVKAVIEKLRLKDVILVGHSLGGAVVLQTAALIPERIRLIVGADTCHNLEMEGNVEMAEQFLNTLRADFKTTADNFAKSMFPPTGRSGDC